MSAQSLDKTPDTMQPSPLYFIVRPEVKCLTPEGTKSESGPLVPLIAVDELPNWCEIIGIPRELKVEQTIGLYNLGTVVKHGVYSIGVITSPDYPYALKDASADNASTDRDHAPPIPRNVNKTHNAPQPAGLANSRHNAQAGAAEINENKDNAKAALVPKTRNLAVCNPADAMKAHLPSSYGNNYLAKASPTIVGPQHLKVARPACGYSPPSSDSSSASTTSTGVVLTIGSSPLHADNNYHGTHYCKHWCRHGSCKWGLYCRYTHSMPTTLEDLAKVGLEEIPAWWATAMNMMLGAGQYGMDSMSGFGPYDLRLAAQMGIMGLGVTKAPRSSGRLPMGMRMNSGLLGCGVNSSMPTGGREITPMDRRGLKTKQQEAAPEVVPMMMNKGKAIRSYLVPQRGQGSEVVDDLVERKGPHNAEKLLLPPAGEEPPGRWAERLEKAASEKNLIDI